MVVAVNLPPTNPIVFFIVYYLLNFSLYFLCILPFKLFYNKTINPITVLAVNLPLHQPHCKFLYITS